MKILCWNCQGIENPSTFHELRQPLVAKDLNALFLVRQILRLRSSSEFVFDVRWTGASWLTWIVARGAWHSYGKKGWK